MKLWVDDIRKAPEGYTHARSVNEAIEAIEHARSNGIEIEVIDLDHDLGDYANDGGDAIKIFDYLQEKELIYPIEIHTQNPVGRQNMIRAYESLRRNVLR